MIDRRFRGLWGRLQGRKPHLPQFLSEVQLQGIRGIENLRVSFDYPVSVIAGANGSGKTTVLFAAACAYAVPAAGVRDFVPSTLFPDHRPRLGRHQDERGQAAIHFDYSTPGGRMSMRWRRGKGWNRSFLGRRQASQPQRQVYLRTLSNLSNPSEVRGVLSMSRLSAVPRETPMTSSQIHFVQQILPFRYAEVVDLSSGKKNLLFAEQAAGVTYSELHMAAGERAILRLSQEIAQLKGALVLIDEVEAGLHPWVQQLLMLQLQQVALRNDLQVIVTTHSQSVLDAVPEHGRIFLDRDQAGRVTVIPAYSDVVQSALYGRSRSVLNLLCEDDAAEGILRGLLDILLPREKINVESVRIGRDTGADEFPAHAAAFRKFGQIHNFVFVLDGDKRDTDVEGRIRGQAGIDVPILFLPSSNAPEIWLWASMQKRREEVSKELGVGMSELAERMQRLDSVYDSASNTRSEIAKDKLRDLAEALEQPAARIGRLVARLEAGSPQSDLQPLVEGVHDALMSWRQEYPPI